jgi:hypothetical protein
MKDNIILFVYGPLTFPEIVIALTGNTLRHEEASLDDYLVKKVIG